jgi:hypothetical protein
MTQKLLVIVMGWMFLKTSSAAEPEKELRPLSTDRPDTTESARTVDAGHFQFEWELAAWERAGKSRNLTLGELNAKFGLNEQMDFQLVLPFYQRERNGPEGFGDIEVRLKWNLWGNDEDSSALALMPYLKLPTARDGLGNDALEGGLIVPLNFAGPGEWDFGTMIQVDILQELEGSNDEAALLYSFTASHPISDAISGFVEIVTARRLSTGADWEVAANTGLVWAWTPTWQLDAGIRIGLSEAAPDLTPFCGVSVKF